MRRRTHNVDNLHKVLRLAQDAREGGRAKAAESAVGRKQVQAAVAIGRLLGAFSF